MLEVVFSESAKGCILFAQHCADSAIGKASSCSDVMFIADEGETEDEARKAVQEYQQRVRQRSASLGGSRQDVYCIDDFLDYGPLQNGIYSKERLEFARLLSVWPQRENQHASQFERTQENLRDLLRRIENKESVRIWYSDSPQEACGMLRLCAEIEALPAHGEVFALHQPAYIENSWGSVEPNCGWGGVEAGLLASFTPLAVSLSDSMIRYYAAQWQALCKTDSNLRAVINGRVQAVDDSFYDGFLLDAIDTMPQEFNEAEAICKVMDNGLCVSDCWLANRIDNMVEAEIFLAVTKAPEDKPRYRRMLKKTD